MSSYLIDIVNKQKSGCPAGIISICTANSYAIKAAMNHAKKYGIPVLIEATANQVDQNGGYTGMTPAAFAVYVRSLADSIDFPNEKIILGGDHLGPLTRCTLEEDAAMEYAEELVRDYVAAGFTKIHLDTSMRLKSDPSDQPLPVTVVASRGARLCRAAEQAYEQLFARASAGHPPLYVIGSEVPVPGGTVSEEEESTVTTTEHCRSTFETYKDVFNRHGLQSAFDRVIALVVQTGAEFGDNEIFEYSSAKACSLTEYGRKYLPLVFEGHSTDYQTTESLHAMVKDGIAILKVGPALTFALREALFTLEMVEQEINYGTSWKNSNFREVLELAMLNNPDSWRKYYHGDARNQRFARKYSFSDRARYYLNDPEVEKSINCLIKNINSAEIPLSLMSQYLPREMQELKTRKGQLMAEDLIHAHIGFYLEDYYQAVIPETVTAG